MQTLKIRAVQTDIIWENPKDNLRRLSWLLQDATSHEMIVLPEMFATGFTMCPEQFAQPMDGEIVSWMKEFSYDKLVCGSVAIKDAGHYYNRFIACASGEIIAMYDKRHLFSYAGEHLHYTSGSNNVVFDYLGWKIKPLVCYDLRFPVWCRNREEADVMLFCANWPAVRIQAWNTLLPARAVENQCYVLGVNRVGTDGNAKLYNGQSQLFDVSGKLLLNCGDTEFIEHIMLEKEKIHSLRNEFPFLRDADEFDIN